MATKEKIVFVLVSLLVPVIALALNLKTDDFLLVLPDKWNCEMDTGLYVCTDSSAPRQKPGVIIFQFSKAGPADTLDQFRDRLKKPRSIKGKQGVPLLSRIISMQDKNIGGHEWFEALHLEGELPDFYTYYLATRRGDMQFLMTLSGHTSEWGKYRTIFETVIASVRLYNSPVVSQQSGGLQNAESINAPEGLPVGGTGAMTLGERFPEMLQGMTRNQWILIGAVVLSCLMILFALKKD